MSRSLRADVLKLIDEKEKLETELKELNLILMKNNVGMDEPLVDEDNFPLNGVDVYLVRHTRHHIICKQNDLKDLMSQIEEGLSEYYKTTEPEVVPIPESKFEHIEPFASIQVVHPGSPADQAGIHNGDLLIEFGSVNSSNFKSLTDVGIVVQHSNGRKVNVKVKRGDRYRRVALIPKSWSGVGLIGCSVVPIK